MITTEFISAIASCAAAIISLMIFWKSNRDKRFDEIKNAIKDLRTHVEDGFDEIANEFKEVHKEFIVIRKDISDVKERLAFIEATTLRFEIPENASPRSTAAKRMWQKRKDRELENK